MSRVIANVDEQSSNNYGLIWVVARCIVNIGDQVVHDRSEASLLSMLRGFSTNFL